MNFQSKSIVSIVLVIVALALGYFGVLPRWSSYNEARAKLNDAKTEQETLEQARKQLDTFLNEYKQHSAEAKMLDDTLPLNETKIYNVLKNLEDLGKSSGMVLADLLVIGGPDTLGAEANTVQPIDVNFTVTGTSVSFIDFLKKLETNLRIVDVQTISLDTDQSSTSIKYQVKFRTYYQR